LNVSAGCLFVIAGLDPAIHADSPLLKRDRTVFDAIAQHGPLAKASEETPFCERLCPVVTKMGDDCENSSLQENVTITKRRKKKRGRRGLWNKRLTPEEEVEQREAAFAATRQLYAESLPLWRSCRRGYCRRHKLCSGDVRPCLKLCWPLMPPKLQTQAMNQVIAGGPRRVRAATHTELHLRRYPPTNFVY
jgi:hypothetical protein